MSGHRAGQPPRPSKHRQQSRMPANVSSLKYSPGLFPPRVMVWNGFPVWQVPSPLSGLETRVSLGHASTFSWAPSVSASCHRKIAECGGAPVGGFSRATPGISTYHSYSDFYGDNLVTSIPCCKGCSAMESSLCPREGGKNSVNSSYLGEASVEARVPSSPKTTFLSLDWEL